jgi:hypothetical protein
MPRMLIDQDWEQIKRTVCDAVKDADFRPLSRNPISRLSRVS